MMKMDLSGVLKAYVADRRACEFAGYRREDLGGLVRYTPLQRDGGGLVCFTRISEQELDGEIRKQCEYFAAEGMSFEWKVYDFDEPPNLRERLLDSGFEKGEEEAVMVADLARGWPEEERLVAGIEFREVASDDELAAIVRIQERVWERDFS